MKFKHRARVIAAAYALLGGIYIVVSDLVAREIAGPSAFLHIEITKGIGYVLVTAVIFYFVARSFLGTAETERAKAESVARSRQELIEALPNIYYELDERGGLVAWNRRGVEITGLAASELAGTSGLNVIEPEDRDTIRAALRRLFESGKPQQVEARLIDAFGKRIAYLWHSAPRVNPDGKVAGVIGIGVDISRLRLAEDAIRAEEAKLRLLFARNPVPMMLYSRDTLRFIEVNDATLSLYGYTRKEMMALTPLDLRPEGDRQEFLDAVSRVTSGQLKKGEWQHLTKDGRVLDVEVGAAWISFEGEPVILTTIRDLTAEKQLRVQLEQAVGAMSEGFVMVDSDDRLVTCNRRYREMFASVADTIVPGACYADWVRASAERGSVDIGERAIDDYVAERIHVHRAGIATTLQFDDRIYSFRDRPIPGGGYVGIRTDITELKNAQEELHRQNEFLNAAGRLANLGYWRFDLETETFEESDEIHRMRGTAPGTRLTLGEIAKSIHPADRAMQRAQLEHARKAGLPVQTTARMLTTSGEERLIWVDGQPEYNSDGTMTGLFGIVQDITERRETEAKIERYERTLAHAQKMDALGQLTGGVAHDFNNLLLVILGNLDMLREQIADEKGLVASVDIALKAARRGADLTQRLLAYSRQQTLRPTGFSLNEAIHEVETLIRSTVGATVDIRLDLRADIPGVFADRNQFETALLNLALNARDAMPGGGQLLIETDTTELDDTFVIRHGRRDAPVGRYARLKVTDTGTGIAPENLEHVFEPFFTTKAVGEGTGLGLSMVYGFVTQSNGFVDIYSEPGIGTTIKLYFPLSSEPVGHQARDEAAASPVEARHLDILLVEDETDIRSMITRYLEGLGCRVTATGDGLEAMRRLERGERFDVLLTDIVLPRGVSGQTLAERGVELQPGLAVVLMSGYPALRSGSDWLTDSRFAFLEKPFKLAALWAALQSAVGAEADGKSE